MTHTSNQPIPLINEDFSSSNSNTTHKSTTKKKRPELKRTCRNGSINLTPETKLKRPHRSLTGSPRSVQREAQAAVAVVTAETVESREGVKFDGRTKKTQRAATQPRETKKSEILENRNMENNISAPSGVQFSTPSGGKSSGPSGGQFSGPSGGKFSGPSGGQFSGPSGGQIPAPSGGQFSAPSGGQFSTPSRGHASSGGQFSASPGGQFSGPGVHFSEPSGGQFSAPPSPTDPLQDSELVERVVRSPRRTLRNRRDAKSPGAPLYDSAVVTGVGGMTSPGLKSLTTHSLPPRQDQARSMSEASPQRALPLCNLRPQGYPATPLSPTRTGTGTGMGMGTGTGMSTGTRPLSPTRTGTGMGMGMGTGTGTGMGTGMGTGTRTGTGMGTGMGMGTGTGGPPPSPQKARVGPFPQPHRAIPIGGPGPPAVGIFKPIPEENRNLLFRNPDIPEKEEKSKRTEYLASVGMEAQYDQQESIEYQLQCQGYKPLPPDPYPYDQDYNMATDIEVMNSTNNTQLGQIHSLQLISYASEKPAQLINPMKYLGAEIKYSDGKIIIPWFRDNQDCTYNVAFCPTRVGFIRTKISICCVPLFEFSIHVAPVGDEKWWKASFSVPPVCGKKFIIELTRTDGNAIGQYPFKVGGEGKTSPYTLEDFGPKCYITFIPLEPGPLKIVIALFGKHISGSPLNLMVVGAGGEPVEDLYRANQSRPITSRHLPVPLPVENIPPWEAKDALNELLTQFNMTNV